MHQTAGSTNHHSYNKRLRPLAASFRNDATRAEACLWKYALRAAGMCGYTFKRQRPVLSYIAGFMCQPLMLIIELDGNIHNDEIIAAKDAQRQEALEQAGFAVLRFRNDEVLAQMDEVKRQIEHWIEDFEARNGAMGRTARQHASPSGDGDGAAHTAASG